MNKIKPLILFFVLFCTITSPLSLLAQEEQTVEVKTPGSLSDALPENAFSEIKSLKIKGTLNSTDIRSIRELCGSDEKGYPNGSAILEKIDLSEVNFTKGGIYYLNARGQGGKFEQLTITETDVLPEKMFYACASIKQIIVPNSVKKIGVGAFYNCPKLSDIVMPDHITEIQSTAFGLCSSLKQIKLPKNLTELGAHAFTYCKALTEVTIPEGVKELRTSTFQATDNLKKITLPSEMTLIEAEAFKEAAGLLSITIPKGIKVIYSDTFYGAYALEKVSLPEGLEEIQLTAFNSCRSLKEINFPEGLKTIGKLAFNRCEELRTVSFPSTLKTIEMEAFRRCASLESINFPEQSVETIGELAFGQCVKLKKVRIPKSINYIDYGAFLECITMEELYLPKKQFRMEANPFLACMELKKIVMPENGDPTFMTDGKALYEGATNVLLLYANMSGKSYEVQEGTTLIDQWAFWYCTNLEEITLPASINTLSKQAFTGSSNLRQITVLAPIPPECGEECFKGINPAKVKVFVPEASFAAYQNHPVWQNFILKRYNSVQEIGANNTSIRLINNELQWENLPAGTQTLHLYGVSGEELQRIILREGNSQATLSFSCPNTPLLLIGTNHQNQITCTVKL